MQPGAHSGTMSPECCIWNQIFIQGDRLDQMMGPGVVDNGEIRIELWSIAKSSREELRVGHRSMGSELSTSSKASRH